MDTPNVAHLYHEVIGCSVSEPEMRELYQVRFPAYIELGIAFQRLDPRLRYFDLTQLARAIDWYHTLSTSVAQAAS